jgi:MAPEG family
MWSQGTVLRPTRPGRWGCPPTQASRLSSSRTCGWWSLSYGFLVVKKARLEAIEQAKKDGEQDGEERYALPNLYAQGGTSKVAATFNCVQRSHQHVLETFTQAVATSLFASVHYPLAAAFNALLYSVGRHVISNGYAASVSVLVRALRQRPAGRTVLRQHGGRQSAAVVSGRHAAPGVTPPPDASWQTPGRLYASGVYASRIGCCRFGL